MEQAGIEEVRRLAAGLVVNSPKRNTALTENAINS
jgi:hypothetical protein